MKEVFINNVSRLFYCENAQPFIYVGDSLELALLCNEGIQLEYDNKMSHENDLFLLEELQIYTFHMPANSAILITKIAFQKEDGLPQFFQSTFQHEEIRELCLLLANQSDLRKLDELLLQSYVSKLSYLVLNQYGYQGEKRSDHSTPPNEERMKEIHRIIYTTSNQEISLVSLADQLHLTPQYVSQFFKDYFGCTFLHYVASIRLHKAMPAIQYTTKSLLSIAMEYGFANIRSFQITFAKVMHCTPKQYRKKIQAQSTYDIGYQNDPMYQSFMEKQRRQLPSNLLELKVQNHQITLYANEKGKRLLHTWQRLMSVGRARLILIDDIRKQLVEIQKDIGFQMIRFHGMFNDDMHVYDEDEEGTPIYNFHQVNDVLDFLLNIGLKPFVELGFMPKKLALHPEMAIIEHMFIVSPPKDIKKWQLLVQAFIKNCINRYGEEEVNSWYFEFWNNSGLDYDENEQSRGNKFWQGSLEEYLQFYEATYQCVKEINPSLRIGGPTCSMMLLDAFPKNIATYLAYMKKHNCMIDFITLHIYPCYEGDLKGIYTTQLPPFIERIETIEKWMKKQKVKLPLHITEWSTWGYNHQPGFNDECDKALYLIQSMVDTLDQVESLCHWTCSDYTETMNTKENFIFSDKAGLLTNNGIKKAAYHAYTFMRKLGDIQLGKGDAYIFTRRKRNFQLLLFNNRNIKHDAKCLSFHLKIKQIPNGTYEKKVTFLNKESGSAYDVWKKMGAQLEMMEEDVQYLKASALMSYVRETLEITHNEIEESRNLKDGEAVLIEWIYKYQ